MTKASASTRPSQRAAISARSNSNNETPLRALTSVIAGLEQGKQAKVSAHDIDIPGPIGTAKGEPIVFKVGKQTYLAYTQEHEPNFNQKRPIDVASDMAIVKEPTTDAGMPLTEAHLDKQGILVNENEIAVGYSTGGDQGK